MEVIDKQPAQRVTVRDSARASGQNRMLAMFFTVCCLAAPLLMGLASFDRVAVGGDNGIRC